VRAAFCDRAGEIAIREVADLTPRSGEAVVRVVACGICGSDLHWYGGAGTPPSVCPGHEIVGVVTAVAGSAAVREGDRVAVEPLRPCRRCERCRRGDYNLCAQLSILGVHEDGGLADAVRVPVESLYPLPAALETLDAVLTEPLAVAVHGARLGGVGAGSRVLVLGAGAIGLLGVVAARWLGAVEILVTARYPQQAEQARRLGASTVFATDAEGRAGLREAAAARDIDVVLETVGGSAPTLRQAVQAVGPGGTAVVLGLYDEDPPYPALTALIKEVRIVGSIVYNRSAGASDFETALEILRNEATSLRQLVTHRFALHDADRAFRTAADKTTGAIKIAICP
jgi:L-iditol 2-dehydrogenase